MKYVPVTNLHQRPSNNLVYSVEIQADPGIGQWDGYSGAKTFS